MPEVGQYRPPDVDSRPGHGAVRRWVPAVWTAALGGWLLELSAVGFSKPAHNDLDPVSAAAANHQANVLWAQHVLWLILTLLGGALLGALAAGRHAPRGLRALTTGLGALLSTIAIFAYGVYVALTNFRIVF
jgi:hypothetical protein